MKCSLTTVSGFLFAAFVFFLILIPKDTMACDTSQLVSDLRRQIDALEYQLSPEKGQLVNGKWETMPVTDTFYGNKGTAIQDTPIRNWITVDGRAGPSGSSGFKAERGRYHLYVSLGCPYAHRTLLFRKLKRLEEIISVSYVHTDMFSDGWEFKEPDPSLAIPNDTRDPINGYRFLREV